MCTGSQDKDVIHFVCPFNASPIGCPVLGSHIRTYANEGAITFTGVSRVQKVTYMAVMAACCQLSLERLPLNAQDPPTVATEGM